MRLSLQLYTLREACAADFPGTLERVRDLGLEFVELAGLNGFQARELRSLLDDLGLRASAAHVGPDALRNEPNIVVDEAYALGYRTVVLPWIGTEFYADGWDRCASRIEALARPIVEAGLEFAYHNHDFEFADAGGKPGLDVLYETSDPALIKAQLDTYWVFRGSQDPASYIRKWGSRVVQVHLKDGGEGPEPTDRIAGTGDLEWDSILAACEEAGVEFGAIEMDNPPDDPFESVRRCVEFFHTRGVT